MIYSVRCRVALLAVTAALGSCAGGESDPDTEPVISVDASSLHFTTDVGGGDPAIQTVTVSDLGDGALSAVVSYEVGPTGWLTATATGLEVSVAVTTAALGRGHYAGAVTINSTGSASSSVSVPVALDVSQPEMAVSPTSLSFTTSVGVTPTPQTVTVANIADGALGLPTATSSTYLFTATVDGTAAPFTVTVSTDAVFALGTFTGSLTIAAPNAANGPLTVPLTLEVLPPPLTVACYTASDFMCREYTSTCAPARATFEQDCAAHGGAAACPSADKVGGCVTVVGTASDADRYTHWYYAPYYTADYGRMICTTALGGTWIAP